MANHPTRVYPSACTSAYCGRADCTDCPAKGQLDAFNEWVKETQAVPSDPIWCPNVFVATTPDTRP